MKRKLFKFSLVAGLIAFIAVFYSAAIINTPGADAVSVADFRAGNIIADDVFYDSTTMTVSEIQAHLNRYLPVCDTWGTGAVGSGRSIGDRAVPASTTRAEYARQKRAAGDSRYHDPPYVCLQNYYENPDTHQNLYDTGGNITAGMQSAAEIIYNAARKYGVNPQVLLVMIKKESYVWGDNWPLRWEYNTVMGYACPDTAPCNEKYYGLVNQINAAAWQLKYYKEHINSYGYHPYANNYIQYNPDPSCGGKTVYLENYATTSLYIYTPYTPSDAALRAYPAGNVTCGSYGNRNFFMYFSEWFGNTQGFRRPELANIPDGMFNVSTKSGNNYLRTANNSINAGVELVSNATLDGTLSQFTFTKNTDGTYTIRNKYSGLVLDIPGANAYIGASVWQWTANGTDAQKWNLYPDNTGGYYIASVLKPSYVLYLKNNKLVLDTYGNQDAIFRLQPVYTNALPSGDYLIETAAGAGSVMDLYGNGYANGTNIWLWAQNMTDAQKFKVTLDASTGLYSVTSASSGLVLDIAGAGMSNGTNLWTYSNNGTCAQRFVLSKNTDGSYTFHSACNMSYVLDVTGGYAVNGTNIQLFSRNGTSAQNWNLKDFASEKKKIEDEKAKEAAAKAEAEKKKQSSGAQPSGQSEQAIKDGIYIIHSVLRDHYVLDIAGAGRANMTNVWMYDENKTPAQTFQVTYNKQFSAYQIKNPNSGKMIDLAGANTSNGANLWIYDSNNTCAQYWKIKKKNNGRYEIVSACSDNMVMDVTAASTSNGANVQLYVRNNTAAQEWYFENK